MNAGLRPGQGVKVRISGGQDLGGKSNALYAVAVRPGDVAAIPEPQAYALLLAGLGAVVVAVRRRPR
jgi:hypothetical protein